MKALSCSIFWIFFSGTSFAYAADCSDFWYLRNSIYNDKGYCFSSVLGKSYFDNSDCYTKKAKLNRDEQRLVEQIKRDEKSLGCRIDTSKSYLP